MPGSDLVLWVRRKGRETEELVRTWRSLHLAEMCLLVSAPMETGAFS